MDSNGNKHISLQLKDFPISCTEVDELEQLCNENGIEFTRPMYRMDSIHVQASALWSWVTLAFSAELIKELAQKISIDGTYDLLKAAIKKVVDAIRNRLHHPNKVEGASIIDLQSSSAHLRIESDIISEKTFSEAFDTFVKVSRDTYNEEHPVIPTYVVINGDNSVIVMKQNDYIWQYVVSKPTEEKNKDGQT